MVVVKPLNPPLTKRTRGGTQPDALSRDDVVNAALAEVAEHGLDALSVSAVAVRLGVSVPAVYHYVAGKNDLVNRVCESVARSVALPDSSGLRWDDRIVEIVMAMDATFARYPGVATRVLPFRQPSNAVNRLSGAVLGCLTEGGFDAPTATDLLATLHFIVGGWLLGQRPNLPPGEMTPALLERSIRWVLAGAATHTTTGSAGTP
jgi:TetR/AcrR family transcriptional regulator, tetracycline repressor protein